MLLPTKLHRPSVGTTLEWRTRLLERLDRNRHRPLTLISAPAGYGKTTLASMWLESCGCASAWVSLDERDDDLLSFTRYLLAAVLGAFPTLTDRTRPLLRSPETLSVSAVMSSFINDLYQITEPFILVLDNIHLVKDQAIFDLLGGLLRHPLPHVNLVLIGRRDPPLPIVSLRAHGQVTEIRVQDLRLTPSETAHLLGQMLNRRIDSDLAAKWTAKTEGWVTALRLAALSLRHQDQMDDLEIGLAGTSKYLQEYLFADVLAHLPPANREWLLKTTLLDSFCAPLVEAVCRAEGPDRTRKHISEEIELTGNEFVRWLQDENLFLVLLCDEGPWFRFHHLFQSLLQDVLRDQVTPDEIAALYLRASNWCAENGRLEDAVRYALAANEPAVAGQVLVRHRMALMDTGQWQRLDRLLELLPAATVAQSPLLLSTRGFIALQHGDPWEAIALEQQATRVLATFSSESEDYHVAQAELAVLRSLQDSLMGQFARAAAKARSSLEQLFPQALYIRAVATTLVAVNVQLAGNPEECDRILLEALSDPGWTPGARAVLLTSLCIARFMRGDLNGVLETARDSLRFAQEFRLPELLSMARYHLGTAHYLRNEWAQAEPYLLALLEEPVVLDPRYLAFGAFALALIHHGRGYQAKAAKVITATSTHLLEMDEQLAHTLTTCFRVELALRQGNAAEARLLSKSNNQARLPGLYCYPLELTEPKLLLAERTPQSLAAARTLLDDPTLYLGQPQYDKTRIDVMALLALVHDALGEEDAFAALSAALEQGEPGGFVRNFVDLGPPMADLLGRLYSQKSVHPFRLSYLAEILAAFTAPGQIGSEPTAGGPAPALDGESSLPSQSLLVKPLTRRETEVLGLLATDLYPAQMAHELFLSTQTVRTHIRNIYAKLGAHSRYEAVQRARELGLL